MATDISRRRAVVSDLLYNHPKITDINYQTLMESELPSLVELVEEKKFQEKIEASATTIQKFWRFWIKIHNHNSKDLKRSKAARKI